MGSIDEWPQSIMRNSTPGASSAAGGSGNAVVSLEPPGAFIWQIPSIDCLMRLTIMALGGYILDFSSTNKSVLATTPLTKNEGSPMSAVSRDGVVGSSPPKMQILRAGNISNYNYKRGRSIELMAFPLPVTNLLKSSGSLQRSSQGGGSSTNVASGSGQAAAAGQQSSTGGGHHSVSDVELVVGCIHFAQPHEVEVLWLETVKTLADLSNSPPLEVSRRSTYCLQVITDSFAFLFFSVSLS